MTTIKKFGDVEVHHKTIDPATAQPCNEVTIIIPAYNGSPDGARALKSDISHATMFAATLA